MAIEKVELMARTERLRTLMKDRGFDALIIYSDEYRSGHSTYLTNYKPINVIEESPQVVFLIGDLPPVMLLGRLNAYAARDQVWMEDVRQIHKAAEYVPQILKSLTGRRTRIGLVGNNLMPIDLFETIRSAVPDASFESVTAMMMELRQVKSAAEIDLMERAADINDEVLREVLTRCRVGMTEIQVAGEAEALARRLNADIGSATVIMSGPNTNYPAWRANRRKVERGEFLLIDFNPAYDHYCNDGGITVLMPGASREQADALKAGHRVLKEVVPLIRPGITAASIFDNMKSRLEGLGYLDNFLPYATGQRGVGHSVGLDVVEPPNLSADSHFSLQPGMTLAIKLDLHDLPGGGYRVEVVVAVTEDGVRPLNKLVLDQPDDFTILS